mgnify:CR=1 FL=1
MSAGEYDIRVDQGSTFKFHITYMDSSDVGITLDMYQANMQIRRSASTDQILLSLQGTTASVAVTGGGSTGYFTSGTGGTGGTGGIFLNVNKNNVVGTTGGILLQADFETMQNIPKGRHFYDLELKHLGKTPNEVTRILKGVFEVDAEVTR